ncbi:MAG: DEAD/DEAH box helicase [Sphingobacteriales bacterium]|nr:MAG: DEAD/DEAH box helicase [Sphingobacteriales bacterium]
MLALDKAGYVHPTPIQQQAIPLVLQGRDVLGCAQTGTGKTAAFALPILQLLDAQGPSRQKPGIRVLVLTPTRELAIQIEEGFRDYGQFLHLKHTVIFGGVNQHAQVGALKRGIDILVATPGRLLDLMQQGFISLADLQIFVLDEADRMLDMGFIHDVKKVIAKIPAKRQTLFFSATMPKPIQQLADTILNRPEYIEVTPASTTAETIEQSLYYVDRDNKPALLFGLLQDQLHGRALVFTRTKHGADKLVKALHKNGFTASAIHGNKSQNQRQAALEAFKNETIQVLVATDIAARGIDIDLLQHVVNYEIPNIPESYVHRIGRGGRAGAKGFAYSFSDFEEMAYIKDIQKVIGLKIPVVDNHPYPMKDLTIHEKPKPQPRSARPQRPQRPAAPANRPQRSGSKQS